MRISFNFLFAFLLPVRRFFAGSKVGGCLELCAHPISIFIFCWKWTTVCVRVLGWKGYVRSFHFLGCHILFCVFFFVDIFKFSFRFSAGCSCNISAFPAQIHLHTHTDHVPFVSILNAINYAFQLHLVLFCVSLRVKYYCGKTSNVFPYTLHTYMQASTTNRTLRNGRTFTSSVARGPGYMRRLPQRKHYQNAFVSYHFLVWPSCS